jgi:protein-disulfide isomerase
MSKKNRADDRTTRAAAAIEEQRRQERQRRNRMVGGVVAAILVVVLLGWLLTRSLDTSADVDAPAVGSEHGVTIGPDDAPNTVIIYEDFLCPFCAELEEQTRDDLDRLAEAGKVQVEYRPFELLGDLGDYSARSAGAFSIVLDLAGLEAAKSMHDLLFEHQPEESGPYLSDDELVDLAVESGATESDVRGPIESQDGAGWVAAATSSAGDAGVSSTPTIVLNGEVIQDGRTVEDLADNLIDELD